MTSAHLITTLQHGGAQHQCILTVNELFRRGDHPHLIMASPGPLVSEVEIDDDHIHTLPESVASRLGNYNPLTVSSVYRVLRQIQPDVVQTWILQMDVLASIPTLALRRPWIVREPGGSWDYIPRSKRLLRHLATKHVDAVVANSAQGIENWRRLGYRGTTRIVPNGYRGAVRAYTGPPRNGDTAIITVIARLESYKNVPTVIDAFELVAQETDARLWIVGEGSCEEHLRQIARSKKASARIEILGFRNDVSDILRKTTVFVSLSRTEGMPNAVVEAMRELTPCVLSDTPHHRYHFNDSHALFVNASDAQGAARAILSLITKPNLAAQTVRRAADLVSKLSIKSTVDEYCVLYRELAGQK